jgi:hypothetical protein
MRIRDITPILSEVKKVALVRTAPKQHEIHFWIGEEIDPRAISMHWPATVPRTWKTLDNAVSTAERVFGLKVFTLILKE